jgi:TRAP-type C4-dicarboxylate transport system permease small subunit
MANSLSDDKTPLAKLMRKVAATMALAGGLVLLALVALTCISVSGRALVGLGLGPVPGDFELVEMGVAFAVFAFLPWCHLNRGHAAVELLTRYFGRTANAVLDLVADLLIFLVAAVITWRLALGTLDKRSYHETTFILQLPVWWAYAGCLAGAAVFTVVALYGVGRSLRMLRR